MSFEPEAIRAFEHAGWQRAAASYGDSFAYATHPSSGHCVKLLNSRLASMCSTLRVGLAVSRRPPRHVVRLHKDWIFLQRWSALRGACILKSL